MDSPSLSVIIPTKNRTTDLINTLRSVFTQTRQPDEIVIVDQSNSNDTNRAVKALINELHIQPNIVYIHDQQISGASQARNRGFEQSRGNYIFFLDDDVTIQPNYIETCLSILENSNQLDGVAGYRIVPGEEINKFRLLLLGLFYIGPFRYYYHNMKLTSKALQKKSSNVLVKLDAIGGGWFLIKRRVFESIKYDENLIGICEDQDFFIRASSRFEFAITLDTFVIHRKSTANAYYLNRVKDKDHHECKIVSMSYLHKKNFCGKLLNNLCYGWLCIGLFLDAARSSLFTLSFAPIKGALIGLYKVFEGFKDTSMIVKSLREPKRKSLCDTEYRK
ncbi:MAG: glycosyltransferase family 2 protein [bacterium]